MKRGTSKLLSQWSGLAFMGASFVACAPPESQKPAPETLTALGQPLAPLATPEAPEGPHFTDCPEGWTAQGEGEKLHCRPDWKVEAPHLTDCPEGWALRAVGEKEPREVCLPAAPAECPAGERRDLASATCVRVGTECPSDSEWATPPASAATVLYVRPGGTGDGTQAAPFGTIDEAVAAASVGAVVLLAAGEYTTTASIDEQITLLGACASETRIVGTLAPVPDSSVNEEFAGALHVHDSGDLTLRNVTLAGERTAVTVRGGARASLSDVVVLDFTPQGLWVADEGSTLEVSKSLFTGGRVAEGRTVTPGVNAAFGGHAEVRDCAFVHNAGRSVGSFEGASVVLTNVSITDMERGATDSSTPLFALSGGRVEAESVHISGFYGQGVTARDGTVELSWAAIEHGISAGDNAQTVGLRSLEGSSMSCSSCIIRDVQGFGVTSPSEDGAELELRDVLIAEVDLSADGSGAGVSTDNTDVTLERVEILDVLGAAVRVVTGDGSFTDVRAVDAGGQHDNVRGGIYFSEGSCLLRRVAAEGMSLTLAKASYSVDEARVTGWTQIVHEGKPFAGVFLEGQGQASRIHVAQSYGYGAILGEGSHDVSGLVVEDAKPLVAGDLNLAVGVGVVIGADVEGSAWVTRRISGIGVLSLGKLSLEDAVVADTFERRDGAYGIGLQLVEDADITRLRAERAYGGALLLSGASFKLSDVAILETRSGRQGGLYGQGLWVTDAKLEGNRVLIDDARSAGVTGTASDVTLRDLTVSRIQPGMAFHDGGNGLWLAGQSHLTLERALIEDTFGAGLGASQGTVVNATELDIRGVLPGRALLKDVFGVQLAEGVADCVILAEGGEGTFSRTRLADCARSGLLLQRATATLEDVEIRSTPVGVATQYADLPTYDPALLYLEDVASTELRDPGYGIPSGPPVGGSGDDVRFDDLFQETER